MSHQPVVQAVVFRDRVLEAVGPAFWEAGEQPLGFPPAINKRTGGVMDCLDNEIADTPDCGKCRLS